MKVLGGYYNTYDGELSVDGEENAVCDTAFIQQNVFHRLVSSVLHKYDNIIVKDKGCIVKDGSFEKLNAQNGVFSELLSAGVA